MQYLSFKSLATCCEMVSLLRNVLATMDAVYFSWMPTAKSVLEFVRSVRDDTNLL